MIEQQHSLSYQAFWFLVARSVSFTLNFLVPLIVVRLLDQAHFGLYKQVFLVAVTAQETLNFGMGVSAFYFLHHEPERRRQVIFHIVAFNAVMGAAVLVVLWTYPELIGAIFGYAEAAEYSRKLALLIALTLSGSFLETVATANRDTRFSTLFIVAAQLTRSILTITAALAFQSLSAILWAAILQALFQCGLLAWYLETRFPGFWRMPDRHLAGRQLRYVVPLGLSGILLSLQSDLHSYLVANRFGPELFAVYAVGCFQLPLLGLIRDAIGPLMIGRVAELQQTGDSREIIRVTARVMRQLALVQWPVFFFFVVCGREFLVVLYTDRFRSSWPIFAVYLTMIPLNILMNDPIMRAYASSRRFLLVTRLAILVLMVLGLRPAMDLFGMIGATLVVVLLSACERGATAWYAAKLVRFGREDMRLVSDVGRIGAGAAAGLVTALARKAIPVETPIIVVTVSAGVYGLCYLVGLIRWNLLLAEERDLLIHQWRRIARL